VQMLHLQEIPSSREVSKKDVTLISYLAIQQNPKHIEYSTKPLAWWKKHMMSMRLMTTMEHLKILMMLVMNHSGRL
jgi:hypothetical protein